MENKLKNIKDVHAGQFQYLGRWVDKATFRSWVYAKNGDTKLANSYKEFEELTSSGIWFSTQVQEGLVTVAKTRKQKEVVFSDS